MCMSRVNVYLPDELAASAREAGLNVSALTRRAISEELARRATDEWLDSLDPGEGSVSRAEILTALDAARDELGA